MRFALAHMSCGGSWCWDGVAALLPDAAALDLDFRPGATPASHAAQLGDGDVVAGHSYGSLPALVAAHRFGALVVIDGFAADTGDSAHGLKPDFAAARRAQGDMWLPDDPLPGMRPMPLSAMEAPVTVAALPAKRVFVHCLQSDFAAQAERARERGFAVAEVDAGHLWPLEQPAACAALLLAAAAAPLPRDERFVLRAWADDDVGAMTEACSDADIQRWTRVPKPYRRSDAEFFVRLARDQALRGEAMPCCVADASTGEVLGAVGVHAIDLEARTAELGYWTAPWARRQGVALAGARMLSDWVFATFPLRRLTLEIFEGNEPSFALADQLGARREPGMAVLER